MPLDFKKFIFLQFLVSNLTNSISLRMIYFLLKTFFKKIHGRFQHFPTPNIFVSMLYITFWTHMTGWIVNSFNQNSRLDFQSLFGAPYCSGWRNHCSVFFKIQPNNACQEVGMTFWCSESHKAALELQYVSALWTRLSSQRWKPPSIGLTNNPGRPPCLIQKS